MIEIAFVILFLIGETSRDSFWIAPEDPFFSAKPDLRLSCEESQSQLLPFNWRGRDRLSGFTLSGNSKP